MSKQKKQKMNDGEKTVENKKIIGNFAASTFQLRKAGALARKESE